VVLFASTTALMDPPHVSGSISPGCPESAPMTEYDPDDNVTV
jgi:hypothetical protein